MELRGELEALRPQFPQPLRYRDGAARLHGVGHRIASRRLRGMFALALWTESERRLVLARDRIGIKPLYIAQRGGDLFFGSELKAIFVHPEIERQPQLEGLDCYLSLNYVPAPWTLVEGIEKLLPGTWLEWRDGESSASLLDAAGAALPAVDAGSAKEEFDTLLRQSVARAPGIGCAAGRLVERRHRFVDHPALRGQASPSRLRLFRFPSTAAVSTRRHISRRSVPPTGPSTRSST